LDRRIHLLIVDVHAPTRRDPLGIHSAIWEEFTGEKSKAPLVKPLTSVSYESDLIVRAFVVHGAIGEPLADMPLFLESDQAVTVPLEETYQTAFRFVPKRWKRVLEPTPSKT